MKLLVNGDIVYDYVQFCLDLEIRVVYGTAANFQSGWSGWENVRLC